MNPAAHHSSIVFEGVIGVGKTTLARLLQPRLQATLVLEAFEENPFLSDFYSDRARYAFQTQIFFLLSRYRQQQTLSLQLQRSPVLADYLFAKDRLFAHLNITGEELAMYDRLYEALAENIPPPDLVVYLRASLDTLMARIAMRDRPYERQMDRSYIEALRQGYEQLFASYTEAPLLIIDTDALDFVRSTEDLNFIEQQIRAALAGTRQPSLLQPEVETTPHFNWSLPIRSTEAQGETNWQALGDFLALTQAIGEIGGALTQQPPVGPEGTSAALERALLNAAAALDALARRAGIAL